MKSKQIIILEKLLRLMAVAVLRWHKPSIIAITGSVGKTSAKTAIFQVLASEFSVRENQKNYNNEIGIPLTIIGAESGERNIFKWLWVFFRWLWTLILPGYPKILVLELGIDRPGDMAYFMSFLEPMVGIVTNVSSSHLEFFGTVEKIAKEKGTLIKALGEKSFAILNGDDELVLKMKGSSKAQIFTFGLDQNFSVSASNLLYNYQGAVPDGISFKLNYAGKNLPIRLRNIFGFHYVYAALSAVTVGIIFKMNLVEISQALENFKSPVGRLNLLPGINSSFILDDTYNASPASTLAALETLSQLKFQRKIAVLGDMLELGSESEIGHQEVLEKIFALKIDFLLVLGEKMQAASEKLIANGFDAHKILIFENHAELAAKLKETSRQGDLILVKGSQGMRMEKIVEEILANPNEAEKLLCRQSAHWKKQAYLKT